MKNFLSKAAFALVLLTLALVGNRFLQTYLGTQAADAIAFEVLELESALEKSAAEQSLTLINYTAVWCPSCRKLDQEVFANKEVARTISQHFSFAKVEHNSAQGELLAKQYNLRGFPRVLVLDSEGRRVSELPLSFEAAQYQKNLEKVLQAFPQS
jgi:thiol:disulfide interchange protein